VTLLRPMKVTPLSGSADRARLDAYLWSGERADMGIWFDRAGVKVMVRSRVRVGQDGVRRRLRVRSHLGDGSPTELDRTTFELHPERFVELPPPTAAGVQRRLELDAELVREVPCTPESGSALQVTLLFVGRVRLEVAGVQAERRGLLLRLGEPGAGWDQWMVEGVGEVAIGPAGEPPHRWLVAWRAGDQSDLLFASPRG